MSEEKKKLAEEIMTKMVKLLDENKDLNEGWGKAVQAIYTDADTGYRIKFAMDGTIEKCEKKPASEIKLEDAEASIFCKTDTIKAILDGKLNAMEAMSSGEFRIEGAMDALMKLGPAIM